MKYYLSIVFNSLIVIVTAIVMYGYFQPKEGKNGKERGKTTRGKKKIWWVGFFLSPKKQRRRKGFKNIKR